MPRDHCPAQTYLKQFVDPNTPGHVRVYSKKGLKYRASPRSICFEIDGSNNSYFPNNPRIVENFLQLIEKKWKYALEELQKGEPTNNTFLIIACYITYLRSCTPTGKRLNRVLYEEDIQNYRSFLAEYIKQNPETHVASEELIQGLLTSDIKIIVEQDYPHAVSIKNLVPLTFCLLNSSWDIISNGTSKPFLTSDTPAILIDIGEINYSIIYMSLTPKLAVLIHLNHCHCSKIINFFSKNLNEATVQNVIEKIKPPFRKLPANEDMVENLNRCIVHWAEDKIISNIEAEWIGNMAQEYRDWKVKILNRKISEGGSEAIYQFTQCAMEDAK